MGHSHGVQWSEDLIEKSIKEVIQKSKVEYFPTHSVMNKTTGGCGLSVAISRHGGTRYWAKKLGLEIKPSESKYGEEYEFNCMEQLKSYGYECEKMPVRYPYNLLIESNIKIDVKVGRLYRGKNGSYYTFNLEKEKPTCDIFVCYCVDGARDNTVFIIPSCVLSGKTQLSIGEITSKYDNYIDCWELVNKYKNFYANIAG